MAKPSTLATHQATDRAHLGVREFVDAASALHREVAPDFRGAPEAELVDGPTGRLEAVIGIL